MNEVTRLQPHQRIIVACDVEGSTSRTNPAKAALRLDMYDLLEETLRASDIPEEAREPFQDRGDGAMLLLRPVDGVPKTMLLHTLRPDVERAARQARGLLPGAAVPTTGGHPFG